MVRRIIFVTSIFIGKFPIFLCFSDNILMQILHLTEKEASILIVIFLLSFAIMIGGKDGCTVNGERDAQVEISVRKLELPN